jgi:CRISPR-associated protein Cas1
MNPSKNSLAYDLQEPFRFLVDLAVINLIETEKIDTKDFIRTESYSLRLKLSGAKKVTEEFQSWMNQKIPYQINSVTWSYSLLLKTSKSAQYLIGKRKTLDFSRPEFTIERQDSEEIRKKILSISYTDWKKLGFSKGTLH